MQDTFEGLVEGSIPRLRRYAIALCRNADAADDLLQDTLVRTLSSRGQFQEDITEFVRRSASPERRGQMPSRRMQLTNWEATTMKRSTTLKRTMCFAALAVIASASLRCVTLTLRWATSKPSLRSCWEKPLL